MYAVVNNEVWTIKEQDKKTIVDRYNKDNENPANFVFGMTLFPEHEIWINKEMCKQERIKTLKHELAHCYIWSCGLANAPHFTEEMVCDLVACINTLINETVKRYEEEQVEWKQVDQENITLYKN